MSTVLVVLVLILMALVMWLVPMNEFIQKCFYFVAVVVLLLWVLTMFGLITRIGLTLP